MIFQLLNQFVLTYNSAPLEQFSKFHLSKLLTTHQIKSSTGLIREAINLKKWNNLSINPKLKFEVKIFLQCSLNLIVVYAILIKNQFLLLSLGINTNLSRIV